MTPRLDLATMIALVLAAALPSGACAAFGSAKPNDCDFAIATVLADCAAKIRTADEADKPGLREECKMRVDALEECR